MADSPASSPLRRDQARAVRERILGAAIRVIEAGEEPTMRAVARAAEVSERTLYRYYGSLQDLNAALFPILRQRASAPMAASVEGLPAYVCRLFTTFDQNAPLVRALVRSPWTPRTVTRPANLAALRAILDEAYPEAPEADRASAAAGLRVLYSAAGWQYLADCGLDLEASIRHVQWMTATVLDALCTHRGVHHA